MPGRDWLLAVAAGESPLPATVVPALLIPVVNVDNPRLDAVEVTEPELSVTSGEPSLAVCIVEPLLKRCTLPESSFAPPLATYVSFCCVVCVAGSAGGVTGAGGSGGLIESSTCCCIDAS